jgi:hypothetical protein
MCFQSDILIETLEGPKYGGGMVSPADCRPSGQTKPIAKRDVKQVVLDVPEDLRDYFAAQCDPNKDLQQVLPDVQAKFDHQAFKLKVMVSFFFIFHIFSHFPLYICLYVTNRD